jgi:cell volume regulation protein A
LHGAVPIVFTTVPMTHNVPGADRLFALVFVIVIVSTAIGGPTLPSFARLFRVTAPAEAREIDVEAAPLEELHADLLEVHIPADSQLHGVEIFELRLPAKASITLVVRDGRSFVPSPDTMLQAGDKLLVVAAAGTRDEAERRLRAVSRRGKLAGWYGEHGD